MLVGGMFWSDLRRQRMLVHVVDVGVVGGRMC